MPIFEAVYLVVLFSLFSMCLVLDQSDLDDRKQRFVIVESHEPEPVKRRHSFGAKIFNFFTFFYFLTMIFILAVVLYMLIARKFESTLTYYVIIIVPLVLIFSVLLYDPRTILTIAKCAPYYVYYIPTYINILQIYAICKTDDLSWGTRKAPNKQKSMENEKFDKFKYKKVLYLIAYAITNSSFGVIFER